VKIKEVIVAINQMQADGVIDRYAIGGAVGATFYLEPVATLDVDIFVEPHDAARLEIEGEHGEQGRRRVDRMGRVVTRPSDREIASQYIVIGGWPVQFLPPTGSLVEEALAQAVEIDVEGTPARVFTAEHLAAIALQTGRAKDKARLLQFIETGALDSQRFQAIIARHQLVDAWQKFELQLLNDTP
jgi:hypothetical protein